MRWARAAEERGLRPVPALPGFRVPATAAPGLLTGKSDEQRAAAALASVLCVQLGPGIESEEVLKTLGPVLRKVICDAAASTQARQAVSRALNVLVCPGRTPGVRMVTGQA